MHTTLTRSFAIAAIAALALFAGTADANGRHGGRGYHSGPHGYGHSHGHWGQRHRGGASIGIGIGLGGYLYGAPWAYHPGYVVPVLPPVVYYERGARRHAPPPEPAIAKGPPDPIFYPKRGQSAQQTEADLHDCNRWALNQPEAIARADVFHRATLACMQGREYTVG